MNLVQILDMHRAHYLDHFRQSLDKMEGGVPEVLLEMDRYVPDPVYKLFRGDYVKDVSGDLKLTMINLSGPMAHAPFHEVRGETTIEVQPFCWNECIVHVQCERFDRQALEMWAHHWMDTENSKSTGEEGLKEVIHYFSPPTYPEGKLTFSVDFGSAPVKAVIELVRIFLSEKGTHKVVFRADF